MSYKEHCLSKDGNDAVFVNFLKEEKCYEEADTTNNFDEMRKFLNERLEAYNNQKKIVKMNIVLFKDAIIHISKIYRVINFNRGHCLLVGVGGSGRHSLTKLSAFLSEMVSDWLMVRSDFTMKDFRFKVQEMYVRASHENSEGKKTVFIFSDNDVIDEVFLEDI